MMHVRILSLLLLACCASLSCGQKVNPVSSNVSYGPEDQFATRVLNSSERADVLKIMRESVSGPTDASAQPAQYGVRWSDVRLAAQKAAGTQEFAVFSVTEEEDGAVKRIQLISIGEVPAELIVRKVPPPKIYEASATVGLFDNQPKLVAALLREFDSAMRAYGAKPGWTPLKNE